MLAETVATVAEFPEKALKYTISPALGSRLTVSPDGMLQLATVAQLPPAVLIQ
jgi:hypothetical protein